MSSVANFLSWLMGQVGFAVCHQLANRSLKYGTKVLPVCARDTGMYLAFGLVFVGLLLVYRGRPVRYPSWPKILILVALILPMAVDGVTSYAGLRESNNVIRIITGALAGAAVAALIFPIFSSAVIQRRDDLFMPDDRRALNSWRSLALLLLAPAAVCLLTWPRPSWGYWLWAPLITVSIIVAAAAANLTLVALIADRVSPRRLPAWVIDLVAALMVIGELALANGMHHLANRLVT